MTSDTQPSVLIIGNFLSASAGFNHTLCEALASKLQKKGWFVAKASDQPGRVKRIVDMLSTIWRERNNYKVAYVDVFSGPAFLWAEASVWLLRLLRKPYILTLRGGNLPEFSQRWPGRVKRVFAGAKVVTTPSSYLYEQLKYLRSDLFLLPNPIEHDNYEFHLRNNPQPKLMWLRAFHKIYNPVMAVEVLAELQKEFPDIHLTMVGPDKDGTINLVHEAAQRLNVTDRLETPGGVPKSDVPLWMNKGDIFINTTDIDNTPVSVIEAMACGLCVVSTNVGGIPYLLEHEVDALLVEPKNPQAMVDAVRRLLTDKELAARLSHNAQQKVQSFNWATILPQWEKLLMEYQK